MFWSWKKEMRQEEGWELWRRVIIHYDMFCLSCDPPKSIRRVVDGQDMRMALVPESYNWRKLGITSALAAMASRWFHFYRSAKTKKKLILVTQERLVITNTGNVFSESRHCNRRRNTLSFFNLTLEVQDEEAIRNTKRGEEKEREPTS